MVAYHSRVPGFGWGWTGVDIFFVLSGYLITGLLLNEYERHDRISLWRFYVRRAARLYPALIVTVILTVALPTGTDPLRGLFALAYITDVVRATSHDMQWLGHTWSLSVEEHFYLAWPVLLIACRFRRIALVALVAAAASVAIGIAADPFGTPLGDIGYNSTITRAWPILIGCALAVLLKGRTLRPALRHLLGWGIPIPVLAFGAAADGLSVFTMPHQMLMVALTCGVLAAIQSGSKVFAVRPLPQIGQITYGWYLYHGLPLAWMEHSPWPARAAAAGGFGLVLAWASNRLLEQPIQKFVRRRTARLPAAAKIVLRPTEGGEHAVLEIPEQPGHQAVRLASEARPATPRLE